MITLPLSLHLGTSVFCIKYNVTESSYKNQCTYFFLTGLKLYFAQKMAAMIKRNRLKLLASEDLFFDEKEQPFDLTFNHDFMVVARRNTWEHRKAHLAHRLANHDYKVSGNRNVRKRTLTHLCLVDSSTLTLWTRPFPILGVSG